jgi:hypothetical protein
MKAVTVKELRKELEILSPKELRELCLRLSRFKKENKELLTYILFESSDEASFLECVKEEIDQQFEEINKKTTWFIKKGLRRILLNIKRNARYSQKRETEVELRIYFCRKLKKFTPSIKNNTRLMKIFESQVDTIIKTISLLHEDLRNDYETELKELNNI